MSLIQQELNQLGVPHLVSTHLSQLTNSIEEAFEMYINYKTIADQLIEFGISENEAYNLAFMNRSYEELVNYYLSNTYDSKQRLNNLCNELLNNINQNNMVIDETSTTSIYISAPGVNINGKQVISADRDQAIMLISDFYGNKPLEPEKVSGFPKFTVSDPTLLTINCIICQMEYEKDNLVILLPCNHYFHVECLENYFKYNNVCPIDKIPL
jgi:hypothetical protein